MENQSDNWEDRFFADLEPEVLECILDAIDISSANSSPSCMNNNETFVYAPPLENNYDEYSPITSRHNETPKSKKAKLNNVTIVSLKEEIDDLRKECELRHEIIIQLLHALHKQ